MLVVMRICFCYWPFAKMTSWFYQPVIQLLGHLPCAFQYFCGIAAMNIWNLFLFQSCFCICHQSWVYCSLPIAGRLLLAGTHSRKAVYYWVIWLFFSEKTTFLVQCKYAHSWAWKIQLSLSGKCSMVWNWAKTNEGLLVGFNSSHLSFAAPHNFHCVWLFASVNR